MNEKQDSAKQKLSLFTVCSLIFSILFLITFHAAIFGSYRILYGEKYAFVYAGVFLLGSIISIIAFIIHSRLATRKVRGLKYVIISAIIVFIALIISLYPAQSSTRTLADRMLYGTNLSGLGKRIIIHTNGNDDQFPDPNQWCDLLIKYVDATPKEFICRGSNTKEGQSSYAMNANLSGMKLDDIPPDLVLLFETRPGWNQHGSAEILTFNHNEGKGCNVTFVDGHVEFVKAKDVNNLKWEVEKMAVELKVGDRAPAFTLLDQDSNKVKLSDFKGNNVLVYFYPRADTPGCTTQACSVRDSAAELKKAGIVPLIISDR